MDPNEYDPDAWRARAGLPPVPLLARLLIELNAEAPARLVREHQADAHGCCRVCSLPQAGGQRWPCTLYWAADQALEALRARGLPRE